MARKKRRGVAQKPRHPNTHCELLDRVKSAPGKGLLCTCPDCSPDLYRNQCTSRTRHADELLPEQTMKPDSPRYESIHLAQLIISTMPFDPGRLTELQTEAMAEYQTWMATHSRDFSDPRCSVSTDDMWDLLQICNDLFFARVIPQPLEFEYNAKGDNWLGEARLV